MQGGTFKMSCLALAVALSLSAVEKKRDWQQGKLLDSERESVYLGSTTTSSGGGSRSGGYSLPNYGGTVNSSSSAEYGVRVAYVIETEKYVYVANRLMKRRRSKEPRLIVNAPVTFAVEKQKVFVKDEDGREFEAQLVKQVLRQAR